ncbi:MAG: ATP-binding protein [Clostridia bacterium]|nr:ATP-binding protein [Clostridia bacterium]
MGLLDKLTSGVQKKAVKCVVYGTEGIGKSTLASKFPNPVFLDTEGGTASLDVKRIEIDSWENLINAMIEIINNPGMFSTVVIDTADKAEEMCIVYTCAKYQKKNIEDFGYGKGYTILKEEFSAVLTYADALIAKGVNVTFIAHSYLRKVELPDETGAYDKYEMKLSRNVAPKLKEWCDILVFCNYEIRIVEDKDGKNKARGGLRKMYLNHATTYDAKNRYGLADSYDMDFAPLAEIYGAVEPPKSWFDQMSEFMDAENIDDEKLFKYMTDKFGDNAKMMWTEYGDKTLKWILTKGKEDIIAQCAKENKE